MTKLVYALIAVDAACWGALIVLAIHWFQCPAS